MKLLILHLSDIHQKGCKSLASERLKLVPQAVRNVEGDLNGVVVIASGDIAFSGNAEEYKIARQDWTGLIENLRKEFPSAAVHFMAVPGNHDCNLCGNQSVREILIGRVREENRMFDDQVVTTCAEVQKEFRTFLESTQTAHAKNGTSGYYEYEVSVADASILIRCYNTALSSTNPERPGQLTYPTALLGHQEPTGKHDYVVSVFHHPYNWLIPNIGRRFREHIERTSDLILTGHEHEADSYRKYSYATDGENDYLEGAVFQETDNPDQSGFHAIWIDVAAQQQKLRSYAWEDGIYRPQEQEAQWMPWTRGARLARKDFQLTEELRNELEDPGAKFNHPARPGGLRLEDIYVFPAVREIDKEGKQRTTPTRIEGRELLKRIIGMGRVLVVGPERSGKSTLAKVLFLEYYRKGAVPVLIKGEDITAKTIAPDEFEKLVLKKLQEQYQNPKLPRFEQLGRDQAVVVIDDFDHAKINPKGRLRLLETIHKRFDRICVLSDSFIQFEELAYGDLGTSVLEKYQQVEILEFGHFLRTKLIEQWYAIGSEYAANPEEIDRKIENACRLIDGFLDKSYLPAYPIFILTFLQAIDTAQPLNTSAGSYGHIYEVLVIKALAIGDKETNIDTKAAYLGELAYWMFEHQTRELSDAEYRLFHSKYEEKYGIKINKERFFEILRETGVLAGGGQEFRFKYPYYYYYFVARYFRDNIQSAKVKDQIKGLLGQLNKEDHSNIWILLTHLSKDPFLVDSILEHGKRLFSEIKPSEFGEDVEFLNGFYALIPKIVLEDKTPKEMREIRRKQLEEEHSRRNEIEEEEPGDEVVTLVVKLNAAFRTIEVLGQIVRNFPGSIIGETKYQLVKECYDLGLRVMGFILNIWREGGEQIVTQVVDLILEKHPNLESRDELTKKIRVFLFTFLESIALNMVKRISHAVGAAALVDTYEKVLNATPTRAVKLLNVSVKLDTIGFPKKEIIDLYGEMKQNLFCQELLRQLVVHHFYLFHTERRIKQAVCEEMDIEFKKVNQLELTRTDNKRINR